MNPLTIIQPSSILLVALGGALGCVLRFMAIRSVSMLHAGAFPLGTMLVNILGSLLIGVVLAKYGQEHSVRAFIVTGLLGGFTTFSAFSWDALQLLQRGQLTHAILYMAGSVGLSLAAVALGYQLVK